MTIHKVKTGDCISSIAYQYGFFPETVWNDPANSDLRQRRKNPNTLVEGDLVTVPEKRQKQVSASTEQCHRFRRKGVPEHLHLQLMNDGEPRRNVLYTIEIDGQLFNGKTDSEGWLKLPIAPSAISGKLTVDGRDEIEIELGGMPPINTEEGVVQRLMNLGFLSEEAESGSPGMEEPTAQADELDLTTGGEPTESKSALSEAIHNFQQQYGLRPTGKLDEETRNKIVEIHQG